MCPRMTCDYRPDQLRGMARKMHTRHTKITAKYKIKFPNSLGGLLASIYLSV